MLIDEYRNPVNFILPIFVIDDEIAKKLPSDRESISLLGHFTHQHEWNLSLEDYDKIISGITQFADNIASLLSEDIYFSDIEAKNESKYRFIRPITGLLSYILLDRLIRVSKFIHINEFAIYKIPKVTLNGNFKTRAEIEAYTKDNALFNQFLINKLVHTIYSDENDIQFSETINLSKWNWNTGFSENNHLKSFSIFDLLKKNLILATKALKNFIDDLLPETRTILLNRLVYGGLLFKNHGWVKRFGGIIASRQYIEINKLINNQNKDLLARSLLAERVQKIFLKELHSFTKSLNISSSVQNKLHVNFIDLFFDLYPISGLEAHKIIYDKTKKLIVSKKFNSYIEGGISSVYEDACYKNAVFSDLEKLTYGIQHSGRGGYLANCPLVAELSISCCDYYISSGWKDLEFTLPIPNKKKIIAMSSPSYSELYRQKHTYLHTKEYILISLGEIFRYPLIYDCTYHVDTMIDWEKFILETVKALLIFEYPILIRSYCELSYNVHANLFDKLREMKSDKIKISNDFRKGVAKEYFSKAAVAIWDIPAGGFIEAILTETPTIAIGANNLMKFQTDATDVINDLYKSGLIAYTPNDIFNAVTQFENQNPYNSSDKIYIDNFINKYAKINFNWAKEWADFFATIK